MFLRSKVSRNLVLRLALIVAVVYLVVSALAVRRDYQDSWVLEGLEIPFLIFVAAFCAAFFSEKKTYILLVLASVGRVVLLLIPALKYVWFIGGYIDQQQQYNLANNIVTSGHIELTTNVSYAFYTNSPLAHILFSEFSIFLHVPVANIMQYIPVVFGCIYPFLVYGIIKNLGFAQNSLVLKSALFVAVLPLSFLNFWVTGTLFGMFLVLILVFLLTSIIARKDRFYWILAVLFTVCLAGAHSVSSAVLAIVLVAIVILQNVPLLKLKQVIAPPVALSIAAIGSSWLMFRGYSTLTEMANSLFSRLSQQGGGPKAEQVPPVLFTLLRVDPLGAITTIVVYYGAELFTLFLAVIGIIFIILKRPKIGSAGRFILISCCLSMIGVAGGLIAGLGPARFLIFVDLLSPFFVGYAVFCLSKKWKWMLPILFACLIALSTIEVYTCDPLFPQAKVLYSNLPNSVPIANTFTYNSIYQRSVANFLVSYVTVGIIASDGITYNQIVGMSNASFAINHLPVYYYPLGGGPAEGYNLFVTHLPGKAGIIEEPAQYRNPTTILQSIQNQSVVYNNGESYVLFNH